GRDCAVVFDDHMANAVETRRMIELDLHTAVAEGDLGVNYLPVVSASNGEIVGVEALLRWRHARRGAISPAVFTPIAEDLGLMPAIGEQVLRRAFADAARWGELEVSVNLSRSQFRDPKLPALLDRLAADHAVAPGRIMLEITEGVLLDNGSRVE